MPMIAITTSNSINVNARRVHAPCGSRQFHCFPLVLTSRGTIWSYEQHTLSCSPAGAQVLADVDKAQVDGLLRFELTNLNMAFS